MTTFNIGTQNAASINNVGGNMTVEGGIHAAAQWTSQVRTEIERAREALAQVPLPAAVRASADGALQEAAKAASGDGDKGRVAELLAKATGTLKEAGALASAGTGLLESLKRAATILGPIGATVLALL
jgi:hypothetical protein